jgi:release factor glutamine methyltransferase
MAHARPDIRVIATDMELPALELAGINRGRLHLSERVRLVAGRSLSLFCESRFISMVVTNPPYIALGDPNVERSVVEHEPHEALYSGPSGLEVISELLEQAALRLVPGGWLISEIGYDQADMLRSMTQALSDWDKPALHRDLAGIERIMAIRRL